MKNIISMENKFELQIKLESEGWELKCNHSDISGYSLSDTFYNPIKRDAQRLVVNYFSKGYEVKCEQAYDNKGESIPWMMSIYIKKR